MSILFAGGRRESMSVIAGNPVELTTAGRFDSAFADAILNHVDSTDISSAGFYNQSGGVLSPTTVVSGETLFIHVDTHGTNTGSSMSASALIDIRDSSGFPWIVLRGVAGGGAGGVMGFYYNSGTGPSPVWTLIGATFNKVNGSITTYDIEVTLGSPHSATLYVNGSSFRSVTFTQDLFTNAASVRFGGIHSATGGGGTGISQVLVTRDLSTIGAKVKTSRATGAGANTAWTGTFADVNQAIGSDATVQNATTSGLKSTHAMGDITVAAGFEIRSVFHWMRAKNDGAGPTNIKSLLRSGGVDYATLDLSGIGLGYGPVGARYDTDPLGSNWTADVWNSIEAGYESST